MIGRSLTRQYRALLGVVLLVGALIIGHGAREAEAFPYVYGSVVVQCPSDPTTGGGYPALIGTVGVLTGTSQTYVKTTTANTGWVRTDAGVSSGFAGVWTTGTYAAGSVVERDPFLFAATTSTAVDPCISFNSISSSAIWQLNGTGVSQDVPNDTMTLAGGVNSQTGTAIFKTTNAGWDRKRLIFDMSITGAADGVEIGILDGALPATTGAGAGGGLLGVTGAWGVDIEIYSGGTPGYFSITNGVQSAVPFADNNANITIAGTDYDRFYLDLVDNGAGAGNMTMTLYRNAYAFTGSPPTNHGWAVDTVRLGTWTVTRPTFTNWRFAFGAHTGGVNMTVKVKHAWARDTSGAWLPIAPIPTRI